MPHMGTMLQTRPTTATIVSHVSRAVLDLSFYDKLEMPLILPFDRLKNLIDNTKDMEILDYGLILEKIQGAETLNNVTTRLTQFIADVKLRHTDDKNIVVVSHGGTIRILAKMLLGLSIEQPISMSTNNTGISIIESSITNNDSRPTLHHWNQIHHLLS